MSRHQEVIDRVRYRYTDIDGRINFPNSYEGDLIKIAYANALESVEVPVTAEDKVYEKELETLKTLYTWEGDSFMKSLVAYLQSDVGTEEFAIPNKEFIKLIQAYASWALEQTIEGA